MALRTRFYGSRDQLRMKYRLKCDRRIWQTRKLSIRRTRRKSMSIDDVHLEIMQFLSKDELEVQTDFFPGTLRLVFAVAMQV